MLTVRDLIHTPKIATRSLTPGIGESRSVSWAHVCELSDPWEWIGAHALVMTTGLAVPEDPAAQCAYLEGMHTAGIAAVTIGERMSAPPLSAAMLERAVKIDFPILETAHETPFITVATAVADAQHRERQARIQLTERLYGTLRDHLGESGTYDSDTTALLSELSTALGGVLQVTTESEPLPGANDPVAAQGRVTKHNNGSYTIPLPGSPRELLRLTPEQAGTPDFSVLQHAAAIVSGAIAAHAEANGQRQRHGSILLANLLDDALNMQSAIRSLAGHNITAPFLLATWHNSAGQSGLSDARRKLDASQIPHIFTEKSEQVTLLGMATPELAEACSDLAIKHGPIALSDPFSQPGGIVEARRVTALVLTDADPESRQVLRPIDRPPRSLFLPPRADARAEAVTQVLGTLLAHDRNRGSALTHTLHVFLSEDRSWLRAAERLHLHRQTLVSRLSRIEQVTGHKLSRTQDAAAVWFALKCAVEDGVIPPLPR